MTFSIYGVSRSGKNYLIQKLKTYFEVKGLSLLHVNGSATLNDMAEKKYARNFNQLTDSEKNDLRTAFIAYIHELEKKNPYIVVDGHYSFYNDDNKLFTVFTEDDLKCYEKFFYLDTNPDDIVSRMRSSKDEKKNPTITADDIFKWQNYEINEMTETLLTEDKELHIVVFDDDFCLEYIFETVTTDKYDSKAIATEMLSQIKLNDSTVILTDCDKTLSIEDSTDIALELAGASRKPLKTIFKGDRYSNYQMALANKYYNSVNAFTDENLNKVGNTITLNYGIINDLKSKNNADILAISAGNSEVWKNIINKCGLNATVLQNTKAPSKYVKYYVAKKLVESGKFVIAIGDSMLDSLMIRRANIGYLATKGYRANIEAFIRSNKQIKQLSYYDYKYEGVPVSNSITGIKTLELNDETQSLITICKSNSQICGRKLREAHSRMGSHVAKMIKNDYPNEKFVVVIMMRSGLCFGEGIADELDAPVLFYDDKNKRMLKKQLKNNPQLSGYRMLLCDGVVNRGKTVLKLAKKYWNYHPIITTNVISEKYDTNNMIPVYASRISKNSYKGSKQKTISNGKGPDTSDRLFKLL